MTSLLGEGGMGQVFLAEHPRIHRKVAIKVLAPHLSSHPGISQRFLAEAKALSRIEHLNVIAVHDFGTLQDGRLYYVMEYLRGRELRLVLDERGRMSPTEFQPHLEQICAGLQAAHEHGVIHRDLKPENIFVVEREPLLIKLLDFGIAKVTETRQGSRRTSTGMVMGTPLFIAPEQAAGHPELISPRTDIYSLGVILYWVFSGRPPFTDEIPTVLMAKHIAEPPPPLRDVSPETPGAVAEIVEHCLAKDPSCRPSSANELSRRFAAAARGGLAASDCPPPARSTSTPDAHRTTLGESVGEVSLVRQFKPRRIWRLVMVGAAALAGGAAITVVAMRPRAVTTLSAADSTPPIQRSGPTGFDAARMVPPDARAADFRAGEDAPSEGRAPTHRPTTWKRPRHERTPSARAANDAGLERPAGRLPSPPDASVIRHRPTRHRVGEGTMELPE